ncbi:aminotransferase class IV [Luteimonas sp. TWI1437]|uniref:aminotransferase class IV n=1 Tax=unclassified Luteimonas TaxID=2629088 RepID=UPI003208FC33
MTRAALAVSHWIDGRPAEAADLAAALVNYGHFSTLQVRGRAVQGLDLHLERLQGANLELFGSPLARDALLDAMTSAVAAAGVDDATLRIAAFSRDMPAVERGEAVPTVLLVALSPPRAPPAAPLRLASHVHVRALAHLKHAATLPLLHARRQAALAGYDDALLVDADGTIGEGALWNVGFVAGDAVVWPVAPALRGTSEGLLQRALEAAGIAQRHACVGLDDCAGFDAAFACNSGGVRAVASIDGWRFDADAAMLGRLRALLAAQPWMPLGGAR